MPTSQMKSYAEKYNVPLSKIEEFWEKAKKEYGEDWEKVSGTVKIMAQNYKKSKLTEMLEKIYQPIKEAKYIYTVEFRNKKSKTGNKKGKSPNAVLAVLKKEFPDYKNIHVDLDESLEERVTNTDKLKEVNSVTIEKSSDGEYRVPADDGFEDGAHYTDDKDDAIAVAKKVFGDNVQIKYRSVPEFVGGKYEKMKPNTRNVKESYITKSLTILEAKSEWKMIYGKCPNCGSLDIKGVDFENKECNSCKKKFSFDKKSK